MHMYTKYEVSMSNHVPVEGAGFPLFRNHKIPGFFKEFDAIFQVYFCIGS